jgi:hypothetical protein
LLITWRCLPRTDSAQLRVMSRRNQGAKLR